MAVALMDRAAGQAKLPETPAVVALFAFGSRLDRDTMQLFARTHSEEVRAAAIASTGQEVLELLHGGLRPQVLVLDALLTKPAVTQVLQEIGKMDLKPQPVCWCLCLCRRRRPPAVRWGCSPGMRSCCAPTA